MKASAPARLHDAVKTIPSMAASRRGFPPRAGSDHTWGYSSRTPGSMSATNPMRVPVGSQNAWFTSNAGAVSRRGRPPAAGTVQRLVHWSRKPELSIRQV
jgi:hypothetical protein